MRARVWLPGPPGVPGRLVEVDLEVTSLSSRAISTPMVTAVDARPGRLIDGDDLRFDPASGGGPLAGAEEDRLARAFGLVNAAFHLQRGFEHLARAGCGPLPRLVVRVGMHGEGRRGWRGWHYRLPAASYRRLPEAVTPPPDGEAHVGGGGGFLRLGSSLYFDAPAHDPAVLYHLLAHHLCRHSADFSLNERRPPGAQSNRRPAVAEGTADYVVGVLLGRPDIFDWRLAALAPSDPHRRHLVHDRTLAWYGGTAPADPRAVGTLWSGALWCARDAVAAHGASPARFDELVLEALWRVGAKGRDRSWREAAWERRAFTTQLEAILAADAARRGRFSDVITAAFAARGIRVEPDRCRRAGAGEPALGQAPLKHE